MSGNPLIGSLVFAAVLIVALLVLFAGRSVLQILVRGPIGRFILRPLYAVTLRPIVWLVRRLFRFARGTISPAQREVQARVGTVPYSAMAQAINFDSQAAAALGEVPDEIRRRVRRHGIFFRSANANEAVDTLQGSLSLDDARKNLDSAKHYYEVPMGTNISPGFLYEDSEEALIIRILRDVDLSFFYVTRRINRNIRRNVLKLIALMTGILLIFPFALGAAERMFAGYDPAFHYLLYFVICTGFALLMWILRVFYANATRNNGQHFNYFVQTYFGRLLSQHRFAATSFASVLNDRTSDLQVVETNSNVWFLNLHWLSARQWFLELYVRNMIFQIARNLWLSYLTVPAYFLLGAVIYAGLYQVAHAVPGGAQYFWAPEWTSPTIWAPTAVLLLIYFWSLTGLLTEFWYEITSKGWLGFQTMDVNGVIERNIGPIVRELVDKRRNPYGQSRP